MPKTTPEYPIQRALKYIHLVPNTPLTSHEILDRIGIRGGAGDATLRTMLKYDLVYKVTHLDFSRSPLGDRILKNDATALKEAILTPPLFFNLYRKKQEGVSHSVETIKKQLQEAGWTRHKAERAALSYLGSIKLLMEPDAAPIETSDPALRRFMNKDKTLEITIPYDFTKNDLKREVIELVNSIDPW